MRLAICKNGGGSLDRQQEKCRIKSIDRIPDQCYNKDSKMVKLMRQQKGFTVVELIVSFSLTLVVILLLFQVIISLKELYVKDGLKSELVAKQSIMMQKVMTDFDHNKISQATRCGDDCFQFTFEDGHETSLTLDRAKGIFHYGDYTTKLIENCSFGTIEIKNKTSVGVATGKKDSMIHIAIPVHSSNVKGDYGLNLVYQYDSRKTSIGDLNESQETTGKEQILLRGLKEMVLLDGETYEEPGYFVKLEDGTSILNDSRVAITGSVGTALGTYTLTYTLKNASGTTISSISRTVKRIAQVYRYDYTGTTQSFIAPVNGIYKVELWGAQGGDGKSERLDTTVDGVAVPLSGANGAYTKGNIDLTKNETMYLQVGGKGGNGGAPSELTPKGGYNGGGNGSAWYQFGGAGGGATDLRLKDSKYRYVREYLQGNTLNAYSHWLEIKVYDKNNQLISQNKNVTSKIPPRSDHDKTLPLSALTDGNTGTTTFIDFTVEEEVWVEIDLGQEYDISKIMSWHYYGDTRKYKGMKLELYDNNHSNPQTVFTSAANGTYTESASGNTVIVSPLKIESLRSRIMVAGAGSGVSNFTHASIGGAGGALAGLPGVVNQASTPHIAGGGGTQTAGGVKGGSGGNTGWNYYGYAGAFGIGGNAHIDHGSGGGSGYYGGGGGGAVDGGVSSGGGGSSFISGYAGCDAVIEAGSHTGQANHYSGKIFTNTQMIDGTGSMPNPRGSGNITGNTGNGYAKITLLAVTN